jgi:hypothetical protein
MPFEWVCEGCRWPNEPASTACSHCGAARAPVVPTGASVRDTRRGGRALVAFLAVEGVVLLAYMLGIDERLRPLGMTLGFFGLLVAVAAAVVAYVDWGAGG